MKILDKQCIINVNGLRGKQMSFGIDADQGYIVERLTERFVNNINEHNLEALLDYMTHLAETVKEEHKQYWYDKMNFYTNILKKNEEHKPYIKF